MSISVNEFHVKLTGYYRGFKIEIDECIKIGENSYKYFALNPKCSHTLVGRNFEEILSLIDDVCAGKLPNIELYD